MMEGALNFLMKNISLALKVAMKRLRSGTFLRPDFWLQKLFLNAEKYMIVCMNSFTPLRIK